MAMSIEELKKLLKNTDVRTQRMRDLLNALLEKIEEIENKIKE